MVREAEFAVEESILIGKNTKKEQISQQEEMRHSNQRFM